MTDDISARRSCGEFSTRRTGGELLADALLAQGARRVACVPGESFLAFLDAAWERRDRLEIVTCRHEGGAAYMAEAMGKLTGQPGIAFVTRGPGACNAAIGVHTAFQDSTPMLLLVGGVDRASRNREAFQEVDFAALFAPLAKRVESVESAALIPEAVARAWAVALGGRPGPVVLVFPEDVLDERAAVPDVGPLSSACLHPGEADMARMAEVLSRAERPLAIVGGGGWTAEAAALFTTFALAWDVPVAAAFRCQDIVDNQAPVYAGELGFSMAPGLGERLRKADVLLVAGARLSEPDTQGWSLVAAPEPVQRVIHVFPQPDELGRVVRPALGIAAAMPAFARAAAAIAPPEGGRVRWRDWTREARADYEANLVPGPCPGPLDMGAVMRWLDERLPPDAIVCLGAGNYTGWPQRFRRYRRFRSQLGPANGSMGYGLPAALAAKLIHPERVAVAFAGDGCFLMTAQELATARRHNLAPIVVVVDNGLYGTIRMHQERDYPGRFPATDLVNPDFAALARSYGFAAETVVRTEDFPPAFERALAARTLTLLHLVLDPDAITTRTTLSAIRAHALDRRGGAA
ncbi:MAG: thiamine pyrophosphate-binding protein [Magnetospirillum sp.]|nr:thiamine pyrophosphate-binding protein [Magnetospirillum sp.]